MCSLPIDDKTGLQAFRIAGLPPDFYYIPNFISHEEEASILQKVWSLPVSTLVYGLGYRIARHGIYTYPALLYALHSISIPISTAHDIHVSNHAFSQPPCKLANTPSFI